MNPTTAVTTHRIKGPSGILYVEERGNGEIPIMFAHSFGGSTIHWDNQVEHLQDTRRVITFDFRAHGKSEPPSDKKFTIEALAQDISTVVDGLRLDRLVLVGHSIGGAAAIAYAGIYPGRVAGLVLVGTPGKSSPEQSKSVIASLESESYQEVMDMHMKQLLENAQPHVNDIVMKDFKNISKETSLSIIKSLFQYDPLPTLKGYKGPLLIISTTQEDEKPDTLASQMPDVAHRSIDGSSHWIQLDKPDEFNGILNEFLISNF
jgi:pimeloyl-ACP methyl ester carboxylesterase